MLPVASRPSDGAKRSGQLVLRLCFLSRLPPTIDALYSTSLTLALFSRCAKSDKDHK